MSSRGWITLFVISVVTVGIVAAVKYNESSSVKGVTYGVDLDQTLEVFKSSGGAKDLKQFEAAFNARGLYPGGHVTVAFSTGRPAIVGFVDKNGNGIFDRGIDTFVFRLEMERPSASEYRVIASDGTYYRYHSIVGDLATWYVAGSIVNLLWARHYGVYGLAPRVVYSYSYAPRGYYRSPSYSRGSWGGRSSGGRFGGK
jgi:hypothetical protein